MLRTIGLGAVGVAAGCALLAVSDYFPSEFRQLQADVPARCEPVAGLGPITAAVPESDRRIFLAVAAERHGRGAIYRFNAADPLAQDNWRDRTGGSPAEFAPANVDYFEADGMRRLFVANAAGRSIDVFDVDEKGDLSLVVSFTERRLANPIAVAATGPDSFYVVNDGRQAMHPIAETGLKLARNQGGEVFYQERGVWRIEASGFAFPSSIAISKNGERVIVGEAAANRVRAFDRDLHDSRLSLIGQIELPGAPQSIFATADGFAIAIRDARLRSLFFPAAGKSIASAVVALDLEGARKVLFHSREAGAPIAPVSTGAPTDRHLLLGSAFSETSLLCVMGE